MSDNDPGSSGIASGRRRRADAAIALALGEAGRDPSAAPEAAAFLREQLALTKLQVEHFEAEHRHTVDGTRASRALEAMKIIMQGAFTLSLIAAVFLFANMIWNASRDHSLVIERFAVPPDLASNQISGEQLAGLVADKLATLNAGASSFRAENTFDVAWGKDINIDVPGSGVSLAEIDRLLRQRLGHQTRIGGTLFHQGKGLRLSLHTGLGAAAAVDGDTTDLDALAQKAAEALSNATQPYRYSKYLEFNGRTDEAMAVARATADSNAPTNERAWAWAQISNLLSAKDIPACRVAGYRAIQLDPNNALAFVNTSNCELFLGHTQTAADLLQRSVQLSSNGGGGLSEVGIETGAKLNRGWLAKNAGDMGEMARIFSVPFDHAYGNIGQMAPSSHAYALVLLHDLSGSRRVPGARDDEFLISHLYTANVYAASSFMRAVEVGDWPGALRHARALDQLLATNPEGPEIARYARERFVRPNIALALVELGQGAEAKAIVAGLPDDCYYCRRIRAWVMGRTGDMAAANRDFAAAVAANPRLSFADLEWGRLLLLRGDVAGAEVHLRRAAELAPRYADPRKFLGDALFAGREYEQAAKYYAEAARFAPRWGANQLMWGKALWLSGSHDEARARFVAAQRMDLNTGDRAMLDRVARATARA